MDAFWDLLKMILPAAAVLYAMFLVTRSFLSNSLEKKLLDLRLKNTDTLLPIRLQAYERICLFLERISPNNMIPRVSTSDMPATYLHQLMLKEIREEYNHNLSQQVYMSDDVWAAVQNAMEQTVMAINTAASEIDKENDMSMALSKRIFEQMMQLETDPTGYALKVVKDEIREVF